MQAKQPLQLLTYAEVCKLCALKVGTLYALVHNKRIPHVRFGHRMVRFSKEHIEQWMRDHAVPVKKGL